MAAKSSKTTTKRSSKRPPAPAVAETAATAVEATTTTTATTTTAATIARTPSHEEIAQRAFELFLARGRQHGRAKEDWLTAERELSQRHSVN